MSKNMEMDGHWRTAVQELDRDIVQFATDLGRMVQARRSGETEMPEEPAASPTSPG